MSLATGDLDDIYKDMTKWGFETWGFTIYRTCYYNDDNRWERFLERFKDHVKAELFYSLSISSIGKILWDCLDWNVYHDPDLENCSPEDIWRYFHPCIQCVSGV